MPASRAPDRAAVADEEADLADRPREAGEEQSRRERHARERARNRRNEPWVYRRPCPPSGFSAPGVPSRPSSLMPPPARY